MIARLKSPSGPPNTIIAKGRNRGKTPNAIVAQRENGLTSLFKEVRVFKGGQQKEFDPLFRFRSLFFRPPKPQKLAEMKFEKIQLQDMQ